MTACSLFHRDTMSKLLRPTLLKNMDADDLIFRYIGRFLLLTLIVFMPYAIGISVKYYYATPIFILVYVASSVYYLRKYFYYKYHKLLSVDIKLQLMELSNIVTTLNGYRINRLFYKNKKIDSINHGIHIGEKLIDKSMSSVDKIECLRCLAFLFAQKRLYEKSFENMRNIKKIIDESFDGATEYEKDILKKEMAKYYYEMASLNMEVNGFLTEDTIGFINKSEALFAELDCREELKAVRGALLRWRNVDVG